jgi:MYXO-CTERM domain-containing protein
MFAAANAGDIDMRTLEADDQRGVCALYPVDDGGCGCAAAGATAPPAAGLLALAAALAALRARRRAIAEAVRASPELTRWFERRSRATCKRFRLTRRSGRPRASTRT